MQRRTTTLLVALALAAGATSREAAAVEPVAPGLRAAILLRALAYDRTLAEHEGDIVVTVVAPANGPGATDADEMMRALDVLTSSGITLGGRPIHGRRIRHESPAATVAAIRQADARLVYLASGLEAASAGVAAGLAGQHRLIACSDGTDMASGCAIAVERQGDNPRVVLRMARVREAGIQFEARFLALAHLVP
jgi:hypothetical protein